jgi:hypothetical protein
MLRLKMLCLNFEIINFVTQDTDTAQTVVGVNVMKTSQYFQSNDFSHEKYQTRYIL